MSRRWRGGGGGRGGDWNKRKVPVVRYHALFQSDVTQQIYECVPGRCPYFRKGACGNGVACRDNFVAGRGIQLKLQVYETPGQGWGVRCAEKVLQGQVVAMYMGEVVLNWRVQHVDKEVGDDDRYLMNLDQLLTLEEDIKRENGKIYKEIKNKKAEKAKLQGWLEQVKKREEGNALEGDNQPLRPMRTCKLSQIDSLQKQISSLQNAIKALYKKVYDPSVAPFSKIDKKLAQKVIRSFGEGGQYMEDTAQTTEDNVSVSKDVSTPTPKCKNEEDTHQIIEVTSSDSPPPPTTPPHSPPPNPTPRKTRQKLENPDEREYLVVNACRKGNVGRFFNHSCEPNLVQQAVYLDRPSGLFYYSCFVAARDVPAYEQLTYDYGYVRVQGKEGVRCHCGAAKCKGWLY